jgi:SEC-C motif
MSDDIRHQGRNDSCPCGSGKKYKHCCLLCAKSSTSLRNAVPCLRSGSAPHFVGVFVPTASSKLIAYTLCDKCDACPDIGQEVEAHLFRDYPP